jgi:predicted permease
MGYALTESLLGTAGLLNIMLFSLPISLYNYSGAFSMLTKKKLTPKQLLQPSILAILLGSAVGLSGLPVPSLPGEVVTMASSCMAPISMLLTGIVVSGYSLRALFGHKPLYFVTALRLVIIPCLLGLATKLIYPPALPSVLLLYAMPTGLNTILFPRLVGENCEIGAGLACVSTVLSCVTIPLILSIFL